MTNSTDMLSESWTHAQHLAFRDAWDAKLHEIQVLNTEAGKLRAEIDNLHARAQRAPTIAEVLTDRGVERLAALFPKGLRDSGTPINPDETAISVIWCLVRYIEAQSEKLDHDDDRHIQLSIDAARMTRALAEYAMQGVGV